jgi:hypothetical protein
MLLFQGVGARIPHFVADPLFEVVLPLWRGAALPSWWTDERGERFARNLVSMWLGERPGAQAPSRLAGHFLPLVFIEVFGPIAVWFLAARRGETRPGHARSDLGVDQQQ